MESRLSTEAEKEILTVIRGWRVTLSEIGNTTLGRLLPSSDAFSYAITLDNAEESTLSADSLQLKQLLLKAPFGTEALKQRLANILNLVPQLKIACLSPWGLAKALDVLLFNVTEDSKLLDLSKLSVEQLLTYLSSKFFETPYSRMALLHLYNLKTDNPKIDLPYLNARVLILTDTDLPLVTGEQTFTSRLHYEHAGSCFLAFQDTGYEDTPEWLQQKWTQAWEFISILKYLKYNVIDVDYGGVFYFPTWVNHIKRYGVDIIGRPRWDAQPQLYYLSNEMLPKLTLYSKAAKALHTKLTDFSSDLRRSIGFAGDRYEYHHTRIKFEDQLIELVIALEALFSPAHEGELRFRISQGVAVLLAKDPIEREQIFRFIKKMYDERSAFVHGGKNPITEQTVTRDDIARLGDYVRESILRFSTLYVQGEKYRQKILDEIVVSTLNAEKAEALRQRSDTDRYLSQQNFED